MCVSVALRSEERFRGKLFVTAKGREPNDSAEQQATFISNVYTGEGGEMTEAA